MNVQTQYRSSGCLGWVIVIITILAIGCMSCSKQVDYSYLNTDRTQKMIRVSKWFEFDWTYRDSSFVRVEYNAELLDIRDTTTFPITCPLSGIEIRYYKIQ